MACASSSARGGSAPNRCALSPSWAASISRSSAEPRRWRRPGSRRSRMSTSTTSIRRACGSSASTASVRCRSRWTASAAASTPTSTPKPVRNATRCSQSWAPDDRAQYRRPGPWQRRRGPVRGTPRFRREPVAVGDGRRQGAAGQVRVHADGPGRLQRGTDRNPSLSVTVAVKGLLGKCGCTRMVQGGYNVALAEGDSGERHFMDTIEGSKWLAHQELAWTLVTKAVERIHELENEPGCFFDRTPDGSVHQKAFAGQTFDRTVHKGDLTGIEIVNRLSEQVWKRDVNRLEDHRALDLIPSADGATLAGALLLDMRSGEIVFARAKAVLLATGGGPTMYRYHTPSGDKTCDGLARALRLGLTLRDMEMVQFHPTGLLAGAHTRMTGTVLEEGLRGSGGHLLNGAGERFMLRFDPRGERATRDIVSRGIYAEMRSGRTTPNGGVWIAMGHLGADNVRRQFKGMVERCADCGFDLAGGRVEVVPTAHYMMGGIEFRPDCT